MPQTDAFLNFATMPAARKLKPRENPILRRCIPPTEPIFSENGCPLGKRAAMKVHNAGKSSEFVPQEKPHATDAIRSSFGSQFRPQNPAVSASNAGLKIPDSRYPPAVCTIQQHLSQQARYDLVQHKAVNTNTTSASSASFPHAATTTHVTDNGGLPHSSPLQQSLGSSGSSKSSARVSWAEELTVSSPPPPVAFPLQKGLSPMSKSASGSSLPPSSAYNNCTRYYPQQKTSFYSSSRKLDSPSSSSSQLYRRTPSSAGLITLDRFYFGPDEV